LARTGGQQGPEIWRERGKSKATVRQVDNPGAAFRPGSQGVPPRGSGHRL